MIRQRSSNETHSNHSSSWLHETFGGFTGILVSLGFCILLASCGRTGSLDVSFSQSASTIEAYDFVEVTANVSWPRARNPFTDASLTGWFEPTDGGERQDVEGFCDSSDGSVFRIRFMATRPGSYRYSVEYRQGSTHKISTGTFQATDGRRRGPIRVDSQHPWHFVWEGTGEHYFFNGTTAYWLMGWKDDPVIQASIERLHRLEINRMRVTISGRSSLSYGEPVINGPNWTEFITPWPAKHAEDIFHPGFDYQRFDIGYWQKFDRALRYARDRDMVMSLVLDMNDGRVHPAEFSSDERRFIHYAIDRFGAFSNITWDLGDDLDGFRNPMWTRVTGLLIKKWDDNRHLATSHPLSLEHEDRSSSWFDFTSFQEWSRQQHSFMLDQRAVQRKLGRIIPQANEEYGYEDHYPFWAAGPPSESADVLRRTAWDIVMAGGYQTTGESARRGTNVWPDTGGGWMNGRGDDTMTMLQGYAHVVDFMTSFPWWEAEPHDELVDRGNYCLAKPGEIYAVYLPYGGSVTIRMLPGHYEGRWFDTLTGEWQALRTIEGSSWASPSMPSGRDWALLIRKK
jgi:Protein of unknown function (DUF4038)/Domain of unknown function (DUF5060)/Putative collagen-binding domain of a collagenase